jgi:hypothetical protein
MPPVCLRATDVDLKKNHKIVPQNVVRGKKKKHKPALSSALIVNAIGQT